MLSSIAENTNGAVGTLRNAASKAGAPAIGVGAAAAGVAGGLLLKNRLGRRKVFGVPLPRSIGKGSLTDLDVKSVAKSVGKASKQFGKTSKDVSRDIERVGTQAERSPSKSCSTASRTRAARTSASPSRGKAAGRRRSHAVRGSDGRSGVYARYKRR